MNPFDEMIFHRVRRGIDELRDDVGWIDEAHDARVFSSPEVLPPTARREITRGDVELAGLVAGAIVSSVDLLMKRGKTRLKGVDWDALRLVLRTFTDDYQAKFAER